jgi:hypothetical protein
LGGGEDAEFGSDAFDLEENRVNFSPLILQQPPFEEHLLQRTLWAEIEKLYFNLLSTNINKNVDWVSY